MSYRPVPRRAGRMALPRTTGPAGRRLPRAVPVALAVLLLTGTQALIPGGRASAGTGGALLGAYVGGGYVETDIKASITGFETKDLRGNNRNRQASPG